MFLNADIVVKAVMVGLLFASLVTWTVWLAKSSSCWRASGACARRSQPQRARARSPKACEQLARTASDAVGGCSTRR